MSDPGATPNEKERLRWNAPGIDASWQKRERVTALATPALLDLLKLQPGERVLDVGCGGGLLAIEAAKAVAPAGSVVGIDLSEPLTRLAAQRAADAGVANVRFVAGDAQTDDISGAPFDVITSQFGVMFFADPIAAFSNMRRSLSDRGRLAFACWQPMAENHWYHGHVLAKYAPPPLPPAANGSPPPGPFAFGNAYYVRALLRAGRFAPSAHQARTFEAAVSDDTLFDRESLAAMRLDAQREEQAWRELQAFTKTMRGDDGKLHLRLAMHFFAARAA